MAWQYVLCLDLSAQRPHLHLQWASLATYTGGMFLAPTSVFTNVHTWLLLSKLLTCLPYTGQTPGWPCTSCGYTYFSHISHELTYHRTYICMYYVCIYFVQVKLSTHLEISLPSLYFSVDIRMFGSATDHAAGLYTDQQLPEGFLAEQAWLCWQGIHQLFIIRICSSESDYSIPNTCIECIWLHTFQFHRMCTILTVFWCL